MKITIRSLNEKDAYTSVKWRNDPDIWALTGNRPNKVITIEDELNWIKKVISNKDQARFAIIADEKYIGNIYITDIVHNKGQYHIFIGEKNFWGKGIAYKASKLLINFAKNDLKLKEIYLSVKLENIKAIRLYEKLGFKEIEHSPEYIKMTLLID